MEPDTPTVEIAPNVAVPVIPCDEGEWIADALLDVRYLHVDDSGRIEEGIAYTCSSQTTRMMQLALAHDALEMIKEF